MNFNYFVLVISATPQFRKIFSQLENSLKEEALVKLEMFRDPKSHINFKVHKLKGNQNKHYCFSVNYKIRIVFIRLTPNEIVLTAIGDHDIYT